jgi:hypothetical protein
MVQELFRVAICLGIPTGTVIVGSDARLDELPLEELRILLPRITSISILGDQCELRDLQVNQFQVFWSISGRLNLALLLSKEVLPESVPIGSLVTFDSPEDPSP